MATASTSTQRSTSPIPTRPPEPPERPTSTRSTRQALARAFQNSLTPSTSSINSTHYWREVQVKPKDHDLQELDSRIQEIAENLSSLKLFEGHPTQHQNNLLKMECTLAKIQHSIDTTGSITSHVTRTVTSTPKEKDVAKQLETNLEHFQLVVDVVNKNICFISGAQKDIPITLKPGLINAATTLVSSKLIKDMCIQKGVRGQDFLSQYEDGSVYITKRPPTRHSLLKKCPINVTPEEKKLLLDDYEQQAAKKLSDLAKIYYGLPIHPAIAPFIGITPNGDLLIKHIPGKELPYAINPTLSIETILSITTTLADGIDSLHKAGWIHCSLTTRSILLTEDNRPIIIDFSQAQRELTPHSSINEEMFNTLAPETLLWGEPKDNRVDTWSLGFIMYSMITKGGNFYYDLAKHLKKPITKSDTSYEICLLIRLNADTIDSHISAIIDKLRLDCSIKEQSKLDTALRSCLKIKPAERASAEDLLKILK